MTVLTLRLPRSSARGFNPGSSGTFLVGGVEKLVGASNYACNIGLNRRISGGVPDKSWTLNGPNYVASSWR